MKYLLSLLTLFIVSCAIPGKAYNDFRNTKWGMTKENVLKLETANLLQTNDNSNIYLVGDDKLGKYQAIFVYTFGTNNSLFSGSYLLTNVDQDALQYFLLNLSNIYGKSITNTEYSYENSSHVEFCWSNKISKIDFYYSSYKDENRNIINIIYYSIQYLNNFLKSKNTPDESLKKKL